MKKLWLVACLISVIGVDNSWAEQEWQSTNPDPTDIERSKKEAIYSNCTPSEANPMCKSFRNETEIAKAKSTKKTRTTGAAMHIGGVEGKGGQYSNVKPEKSSK